MTRRAFRTTDGVNLSFLESGAAHKRDGGVAIAFIPGWCMPGDIWRKQLEALGTQYHAVALDPRGQGRSDVPAKGYTAERRAADIDEFLRPLSRVVLVGWSLGAIEALQYLDAFGSEKIAGLVLVDSSVGEEPAPPPGSGFTDGLKRNRDAALNKFVRAIFSRPRPKGEIDALVRGAKRMSLDNSIALLSYPFPRTHWKEIAHAFDKPLLYVVTPQFAAQAENLEKNRPGTRVEVFERAGHALFVDEPERFNSLLADFVKQVASQQP
ncbi:MAG TPA: alpha/beta hydrolase [Candidatus Binatia bacterium]